MFVTGAEYKSAISTSAEKYQALKFVYTEQELIPFKMTHLIIYPSDQQKQISLEYFVWCECILRIDLLETLKSHT